MHNSPILAVRGEAGLDVEPDIARIEVSIAVRGPDRAATLLALAERDAAVSLDLRPGSQVYGRPASSPCLMRCAGPGTTRQPWAASSQGWSSLPTRICSQNRAARRSRVR